MDRKELIRLINNIQQNNPIENKTKKEIRFDLANELNKIRKTHFEVTNIIDEVYEMKKKGFHPIIVAKKDAEINRKIKSGINNMSNVNIFAGKYNCGHVFRSPNKKVKIKNVFMDEGEKYRRAVTKMLNNKDIQFSQDIYSVEIDKKYLNSLIIGYEEHKLEKETPEFIQKTQHTKQKEKIDSKMIDDMIEKVAIKGGYKKNVCEQKKPENGITMKQKNSDLNLDR